MPIVRKLAAFVGGARTVRSAFVLLSVLAAGCAQKSNRATPIGAGGATEHELPDADACLTPQEGCPCDNEAEVIECGRVARRSEGYTSCSMGERVCDSGEWGPCEGDRLVEIADSTPDQQQAQALGMSGPCIDNPCDPYCQVVVDNGTNLMVDNGLSIVDGGLTLTAVPPDPAANTCTDIVLTPPTQTLTVTEFVPTKGLFGQYYGQISTSVTSIPAAWTVVATRVDPTINFEWGNSAPGPGGIAADGFSVRWDGYVRAPAADDYTFYVRGDDGVRLWVNGALVIPKGSEVSWKNQGATQYSSNPVTMAAGTPVQIRMEYYDNSGGATAQLKWSSASIAEQIIPETYLSPTANFQSPYVTTPASATLSVGVVPPTCYDGMFTAAWSLDRLDRATINNGVLSLQTPVSGPIAVSAYVQEFSDTATVNVVVNATENIEAPPGAVATFGGTSTGADTATILYPYDATVLPLALKPPVLQWDTGGVAASAIKVSLAYPSVGTPTYQWSKILPAPSNSRYSFTRDQWEPFERTAKGGTGRISLQRVVMGQLKDEISKTVKFANAPLRGKIYYTQYGSGAKIMRLDPGADTAPVNAFGNNDGCPVCHSMSANGTKFATSNWSYSTVNGGISNVNSATGDLVRLSDFQNPQGSYGGTEFRGFAWAPLTPDGKYIFSANSIYGNTNQTIVGINDATNTVAFPNDIVNSGGQGTGLQADYYSNTTFSGPSWRRIEAHPDFDWTGAPGGPLPVDGYSVTWSGEVEGMWTEPYTFSVETNTGVRLSVGGTTIINELANTAATTFTGVANLTRGGKSTILLEALDGALATTKVRLFWQSKTQPLALIPQSQLFPAGGQRGAVVVYQDATNGPFTRLESDLSYDWGDDQPMRGRTDATQNIAANTFTSTWDARVEAPTATDITWCINSDDGYVVTIDGVTVLTSAASTGNVYVCSATATTVTAGQMLAVRVAHTEGSGNARMKLAWRMSSFITTQEDIPRARTFVPAAYTPPTNGLAVTVYDTNDWGGATVPQNATSPQAFNTYVPTPDYTWSSRRFSMGRAHTDNDYWAMRMTGRLQPACTGMHEFEAQADDQISVWIGGERLVRRTGNGTSTGLYRWLDAAQTYDFKVDYVENTGDASVHVKWKPVCNGSLTMDPIPTANLSPTGYSKIDGYIRQGGDNSTGNSYYAWETPNNVGDPAIDVTAQSVGNWGLKGTSMMVPTFSPDGTKMVFVDGDSATGAGWRKGLSTVDFDQTGKLFKNRRQMVNNFPWGDVIKWPTYESDSKSVIYQTTTPGDSCCTNSWTKYGYMGPSNYFEDPGKMWSVDTTAANPTPVELVKLNSGERNIDRNKSYQATMLPTAAGGYRWAVFTSTRPYGNTINGPALQQDFTDVNNYVQMLNYQTVQSMLWVSAVDDTVSAGADRSHPAFFLPNQAYSETGGHYLNERAYWVTEPCRAAGSGSGSTCDVDEDCCGGTASPPTAVCRIDSPLTSPPTRHCSSVPAPNACFAAGAACTQNSDCCFNYPCVANVCVKPPPLPTYHPQNYQRLYTAECGKGTLPVWRFFDWQAETPPTDSAIEIYAESSDDPGSFQTLPVAPTAVMLTGVVKIATVTGATVTGWVGEDVGAKFKAAGVVQRKYLLITMRLIPNIKITATPTVTDWRQSYSCPPQE